MTLFFLKPFSLKFFTKRFIMREWQRMLPFIPSFIILYLFTPFDLFSCFGLAAFALTNFAPFPDFGRTSSVHVLRSPLASQPALALQVYVG